MALCLKRRQPARTSLDGVVCSNWTTIIISILTLTTGLLFLFVWICSLKESQRSPFETLRAPHSTREVRLRGIDQQQQQQQSPAFVRSAVEMSSDDRSLGQGTRHLSEPSISKTDSTSRLKVNSDSSVKTFERRTYASLPKDGRNATHKTSEKSMMKGTETTSRRTGPSHRLFSRFRQRHRITSWFLRRKLRLERLNEGRETLLTLDIMRISLHQPTLSKATQINRPRPKNKQSTRRPCCLQSNPLCRATSIHTKRRKHRRKRSALAEEEKQKQKKFLNRLVEAAMSVEERTARNLTDSLLDSALNEETQSVDNQTGIKNNTDEQKHDILLVNKTAGKENTTVRKNSSAEVGESILGENRGEGFGNFLPGEIGGAGDGKLIISAQILNGSESKELGQIVVNSKNRMEVAIKVMNTSSNASTEQKQWTVELNGEQKMFVAAVIAIASIVAVGTLVFACVWCLYDHEGLCIGVFPCIKPPKDNFSPQRWWMETLARRVENLESQPFLATEKHKRTSTKYQMTNKDEGRLSQMVSRLSERMSKTGNNMTKKEQMARNSQMARASQEARDSQMENDSEMARDVKMARENMQRRDSEQDKSNNHQRINVK